MLPLTGLEGMRMPNQRTKSWHFSMIIYSIFRSLSAVVTCEHPILLNISDSLLSGLQSLSSEETFQPIGSLLTNNLGLDGTMVYTEIKVTIEGTIRGPTIESMFLRMARNEW